MPLIRGRRGFTLVELLIVLVMLGLVGTITVRVLTDSQRLTVAQGERAMMQSTARTGVLVLPTELREINPSLGDITAMNDTSIEYRALRTLAVTCVAPTTTQVRVPTATIQGIGSFAVGDSVLVFMEGADKHYPDDDDWGRARVAGRSTATACPDGRPGTTLTLEAGMKYGAGAGTNVTNADLVNSLAAVVRGIEHTTMAAYRDPAGVTWLGMRTNGAIQPILGPLAADSGLRLTYRDAAGNVTATPANVTNIDVRIVAVTDRAIHNGSKTPAVQYDSLTTRIALRNTF